MHADKICLWAAVFVFALVARPASAQGLVEYGAATSSSGSMAAAVSSVKPPFPTSLPVGDAGGKGGSTVAPASNAAPGAVNAMHLVAGHTDAAAATNRQYFKDHAGADAADMSVASTPDHATVWIDDKFVGSAPVTIKLAPGKHHVVLQSANMQPSDQSVTLAAKESKSLSATLQSLYQSTVAIQWPGQK